MPQNPLRSPHNELQGHKRPSSVLVRGFSALEIAKNAGLVPAYFTDAQFIDWLKQPATDAAAAVNALMQGYADTLAAYAAAVAIQTFGSYETVGTGAEQQLVLPPGNINNEHVHIYYNGLLQPHGDHYVDAGAVYFTADAGTRVIILLG